MKIWIGGTSGGERDTETKIGMWSDGNGQMVQKGDMVGGQWNHETERGGDIND